MEDSHASAASTPARSTRSHGPPTRVQQGTPSATAAARSTPHRSPRGHGSPSPPTTPAPSVRTTQLRSPRSTAGPARVSPYPQRTPPSGSHVPPGRDTVAQEREPQRARSRAQPLSRTTWSNRLQLIVQPLVKSSINQRDTSGEALNTFVVTGATFSEIIRIIYDAYSARVKGRAFKTDGVWSLVPASFEEWHKVMQLRRKRDVIDTAKSEYQWNQWLVLCRGETIKLVVFEYGVALVRVGDVDSFLAACVRPSLTDRAGALAEDPLQDIVGRLQRRWSTTYRAEVSVWRMWANGIASTLDVSRFDSLINQNPPDRIAVLLRPVDLPSERQLASFTRSASVALEIVNASIEDCKELQEAWEIFGRRIDQHERSLARRKRIIEAMIQDVALPPADSVPDPVTRIENVNDVEHQE